MQNVELSSQSVRVLEEVRENLSRVQRAEKSLDDAVEFLRWNYHAKRHLEPERSAWSRYDVGC